MFLQTDLVFIDGHVNTDTYLNSIIEGSQVIQHMDEHLGRKKWLFMQDGAPAHTSKRTMQYLNQRCRLLKRWPPNSPDLNPIEHLWSIMDKRITKEQPSTVEQFKNVLETTWNDLEFSIIENLIISMRHRILKVINLRGQSINGHWK